MRTKELAKFILERESVRMKKETGAPRPWTKDEILNTYRFCNVHREDDRVTRWLRDNWYGAFGKDEWFAAVVARLFNYPDSLAAVKRFAAPFKPGAMRLVLHNRKAAGLKNFNAAYIVSTNGVAMEKVDYIIDCVLMPLWVAKDMRPTSGISLASYHERLMKFDGLGSFIAAQVVGDLKYMAPLTQAPDWWTWAASGPGSRRGLNRILNLEINSSWSEPVWLNVLTELRAALLPMLRDMELHAQDLQNCLCEFDKYERARTGEGRPKQLYKEITP